MRNGGGALEDAVMVSAAPVAPPTPRANGGSSSSLQASTRARRLSSSSQTHVTPMSGSYNSSTAATMTTMAAPASGRATSLVARKLHAHVAAQRRSERGSMSNPPSSHQSTSSNNNNRQHNESVLEPFTGRSPARTDNERNGWQCGAAGPSLPSSATTKNNNKTKSSSVNQDESLLQDMLCMRDSARGVPISERRWPTGTDEEEEGEEGEEGELEEYGGADEDDKNDDDDENSHTAGTPSTNGPGTGSATQRNEDAFHHKLVAAEPIRHPPVPERRSLLTPFVWLSVSPFPHRLPTVVFPPCDRPWEGDSQANVGDAYVTPPSLDPIPTYEGRRKRIGRKGKYGSLVYSLPEGSVRFSAVTSTFGTAGFAEDSTPTLGTMKEDDSDEEGGGGSTPPPPTGGGLLRKSTSKSVREAPESDMGMWSVRWCKRVDPEEYKTAHPLQKLNHFPGTWGIGRKDNLHKHLNASRAKYGSSVYNFHPEAWILPRDERGLARDMALAEHAPQGMKRNVYIIKQVASACGRQMRLLCNGKIPKGKWIVQRYVHDPLLIYGYKFDLRLYVVVTSYNPLKVYVYEEGLVRFATTPYPRNAKNGKGMKVNSVTAHLTNYSINKHNTEAFVRPEDSGVDEEKGSKWVLSTVKRYFENSGLNWDHTWARIEDLILKTLLSVEPDVTSQLRTIFGQRPSGVTNCFELYGFDVLLRENLEPILMEVNIMPSLSTRCSLLDQRVKANMIADMMTLVGPYAVKKKVPAATLAMVQKGRKGTREAANPNQVMKLGHPFLDGLSVSELECVCQAEEEYLRRTHFKRLFPTATAHDTYRPLFQEVKALNTLLCEWEKAKEKEMPTWVLNAAAAAGSVEDGDNGDDDD